MSLERNKLARERGVRHLRLCVERYKQRHSKGRYFLHEHPAAADSWDDEEMKKLQAIDGVFTVTGPMCAWGMKLRTKKQGDGYVYKPTRFVTNSVEIAKILDRHCANRRGGPIHRHVSLIGGLAQLCAEYPPEMVNAVLEGLKRQMECDGELSSMRHFLVDQFRPSQFSLESGLRRWRSSTTTFLEKPYLRRESRKRGKRRSTGSTRSISMIKFLGSRRSTEARLFCR